MEEAIQRLESNELEGGTEGLRVEGCTELLAYYLLQGELCHAKFLWKRIPPAMKLNPELAAMWNVGQKLWLKDMPAFYASITAFQWSPNTTPIVNQLVEITRGNILRLVGTAYTYIRIQDVATLLGITGPEAQVQAEAIVSSQEWTMSPDGMVQPKEPPSIDVQFNSSEEQIAKLTDYVVFLEN